MHTRCAFVIYCKENPQTHQTDDHAICDGAPYVRAAACLLLFMLYRRVWGARSQYLYRYT